MRTHVCLNILFSISCLVSLNSLPCIIFFYMTISLLSCSHAYIAFHILSPMTCRLHLGLDVNTHFQTSRVDLPLVQIKQRPTTSGHVWGVWPLPIMYPNFGPCLVGRPHVLVPEPITGWWLICLFLRGTAYSQNHAWFEPNCF